MSITGHAKLAGITGWPVGHSLSPRLHGYWIAEHKLDAAYVPLPVRREDFASAVALLPKLGFRGLNVTIPHKEAAYALATEHDEAAKATGAVNTLVFEEGRIIGKNTDVAGVIGMLADAGLTTLAGKTIFVEGAGGAGRAVVSALTDLRAARVLIANRTSSKAEALAQRFNGRNGTRVEVMSGFDNLVHLHINATSIGLASSDEPTKFTGNQVFGFSAQKGDFWAADIVYRPLKTKFLLAAELQGAKTIDGLGMLLHQAVPAFKAWFGIEPKVTPALRMHMLEALKE